MTGIHRTKLSQIALSVAIALATLPALAQNTTSAVGGRITGTDGKPVGGAQVTILHKDSGSVNTTVTDAEGRYSARGLRVGGPYTITITKAGVTEKREDVYLLLAETASVDARLGGAKQAVETIVVTGKNLGSDKFSSTAMGAGTHVGRAELDAFGSIQRNLQDYARLDPRVTQTDKERGEITVGGQNNRYNSITIDGVAINDPFGLEANNLPTLKQPISIDAVQAVQINVSNYDVTQKGYTGANINAVTKSGTNSLKGSLLYVYRDDRWVGQRYNRGANTYFDAPKFDETTIGFTLGGPIIKDKLYFFATYEDQKSTRTAPIFGPIGDPRTNVGITTSAISAAQAIATSRYNFDIGAFSIPSGTQLLSKDALLKLDWNINANHRANVRYTKSEETNPVFNNIATTSLSLSSHWYNQTKTLETLVGQWFADWTPNLSTEFRLSDRQYNSAPKNNIASPVVTLQFTGPLPAGAPAGVGTGTRNLFFGTEQFRHLNAIETKTLDSYFGGVWTRGAHELKFGGDYSQNKVFNAFVPNSNGNYTFNCQNSSATYVYSFGAINCASATAAQIEAAVLENFSRGRPSTYFAQTALPGNSLADGFSQFTLKSYGGAVQDTWTVNRNLTMTYGFRVDLAATSDKPKANAAASAPLIAGNPATGVRQSGGFGRDNTNTIDGEYLIQPRLGFNYTFDSARPMQLRGGFGLFQGAAATVWLSNAYTNTGAAITTVGCGGANVACTSVGGLFTANPATPPTSFPGSPPAATVDFIQSGLGQPSVWKANLGFERELPWWGLVGGIEYLYTKTGTGLYYQHLNLGAPTRIGIDGRESYYSPTALNQACWTPTGGRLTTGAVCGVNNFNRALSNPAFSNVLELAKTKEGGGNLATLSLSRLMKNGWSWSLAYTYSDATEVSGMTSTIALSTWGVRPILNPNEGNAQRSTYVVKDRFNGTVNWRRNFFAGYKTEIGLVVEGRSGRPYSWTFANDINGDGIAGNDLMYIPRDLGSGEVVFLGDTATSRTNEEAFWRVVNANGGLSSARGGVTKRNSSFSPWSNSLDMRISQQLPGFMKGHKASFVLDLFNVGNMLNKRWGRIDEIPFTANAGGQRRTFVNFAGLDATGRYIYSVGNVSDFTTRQARGESQWALQGTFRYEF